METGFQQTSGPILQKKLDLIGILTTIAERQVFFIDEIHRLLPDIEEILYSALEDFQLDVVIGQGPGARTRRMPMPKFTADRRHHSAGPGQRSIARPFRPGAAA